MNQITTVDLTDNYLLDYIPYKEVLTSLIKEDESNN